MMSKTKKKSVKKVAFVRDAMLEPYYIEIDNLNITVKKEGESAILGYYTQMPSALKKIITLQFKDQLYKEKNVALIDYYNHLIKANERITENLTNFKYKL